MLEKVKYGYFKLKTYWRKPPRGYDVSYKEFVNLALGFGGISFLSVIIQWTTLAMGVHMMISYFKVSTGLVWVLGIVGSVIALIRSPLQSVLIDNSRGENGKFKPFLLWTTVGTVLCFGLIPFIPKGLNEITLFSFNLPAIPIMGVQETSVITLSAAVLIMFTMLQVGTFFNTVLNQAMAGIEQTVSTVAQERANISSLKGLICNLPSSIVNIILPILAGSMLFSVSGGWNSIYLYRWVFPFCAAGALVCIMFTVKGTKERVVVNKKYVSKVGFIEGAKALTKNKYFWIITVFNIAVTIRNFSNLNTWITQYSFESDTAKTIVGLYCTTLLMNVLILGMVLGPVLIKKMGKRKVLMISSIGLSVMIGVQLLFYKNPVMILVTAFFQNVFQGFAFIAAIMVSDVMDYIQWETGKRMEGFWQNYNAFVATVIGVFTGMLLPLFLSMGGIGFGDDIKAALENVGLRNGAFKYQTLLAFIGSAVCVVPILFYDLTEAKHANIVRVLKIRAAADNFADGNLQDGDVLNVEDIRKYAAESNDAFLLDELAKYDCLDAVCEGSAEVRERVSKLSRDEDIAAFLRDIEFEEKRVNNRVEKAKAAAAKGGRPFEEDKTRDSFMSRERYMRYFTSQGSLFEYRTAAGIAEGISAVYPVLEELWQAEEAERQRVKQEKRQQKQTKGKQP